MYCNKCGEKLSEGSGLCSKCGSEVCSVESIQAKHGTVRNTSAYAKVFGVANIALVLLLFVPWIEINAYVVSIPLSLFDLCAGASDTSSTLQTYFGSSADQASGALGLITSCGIVMLLCMIPTNVADAYRFLVKGKGTISGFVASLISSVFVTVVVFLINAYISSSSSSYYSAALTGILSITAWPLLVAALCAVLIYLKCKHFTSFLESNAPDSANVESSN